MKKQQNGAALFVVMALLSTSMVVGMSAMQSSLVDERLAGNFRSSVEAQMTAENTLSALVNPNNTSRRNDFLGELVADPALLKGSGGKLKGDDIARLLQAGTLDQFIADLLPANFDDLDEDNQRQIKEALLANLELQFEVDTEAQTVTITSWDRGLRNNAARDSTLVYSYSISGGRRAPFISAIVGCYGVRSAGGSTISSYRSDQGNWSEQPGSFAEQDIPLVRSTSDNANIVLGGNEQIHGGVEALGSVTLNGSSQVFGSIMANQSIHLNAGGGRVRGNVLSLQDVIFGSSARVDGIVKALKDVRLNNWSASVGEGIFAGGDIITNRQPASDHIDQQNRENFSSRSDVVLSAVESQECDSLSFSGNTLVNEMARYQAEMNVNSAVVVGAYPNVQWRFTPSAMQRYDQTWNVNRWLDHATPQKNTLFGESAAIYRISSLSLTGSPSLRISGGDVVIVVDGDFTMGGGGAGMVIDPDSSLTVFVGGRVNFGSVLNMPASQSVNQNGQPTFSLFSSYSGTDVGVNFSSSNRVVANVYAPYTNVSINSGAGFFGSVLGESVDVSGNGSIVYDERLAEVFVGDSVEVGGGGMSWRLSDWR